MKFETTITDIIKRTPSVTSFRFAKPAGLEYKPGQFFFVTLKQGEMELSKHFSFSSSPTETGHIEFTKKLSDSQYSDALRASKVGDWARIDAPYGQFTFTGEYPKIALLGGGIGITPFISIAKYATDRALSSQIVLFYACSTPEDIVFREEFTELAKKNSNLKIHFTVSQPPADWKGATGRINAEMIRRELPDFEDYMFYACGPPPMVKAMQGMVETLGLPKEKLRLEYFTGYQ
jgi:ferredoxin-NADP reductase